MKIQRRFVDAVISAQTGEDLVPLIQEAVRLEHATIPPYLCAYFTIRGAANAEVAAILRSVVIDEMLHMTAACNLILALGESPRIHGPDFIPKYPSELPFGIADHLKVHLRRCSLDQVRDVFMRIEKPESPIGIQAQDLQFSTIGLFYKHLKDKLEELGPAIFKGDPGRQVVPRRWFRETNALFPITNIDTAKRAIDLIVDQGEGTTISPFDAEGEPAHYYRFEQIVKGRKLTKSADGKYAYSGEPAVLDEAGVWNMEDDPQLSRLKPGSESRVAAESFSRSYTSLLSALQFAFDGQPSRIDDAIGLMYEMRLLAQKVLALPATYATGGLPAAQTGLCFEFLEG